MFNTEKTVSLACSLLEKSKDKPMHIIKLMKLLYICDRECLKSHAHHISGDKFVSMDHGPVLSNTYSLMNGSKEPSIQGVWDENIQRTEQYYFITKQNNRFGLDEYIELIIDGVLAKFDSMNEWEIEKYTHENFEEWVDPRGSSKPIEYADVFSALGYGEKESDMLAEQIFTQEELTIDLNLSRMESAINSQSVTIPDNLNDDELDRFIVEFANS